MVNIVGFLQGIRESDDYWTKKSAEARDEYNRFVQSNPDSTVADRIERQKLLGGDMDYLTRLMPDEGNVTKNVGVRTQYRQDEQNQRNRAAASAAQSAARFEEWEAGADNRKKLQELQLSNATTGVQLAKRKEVIDGLALEPDATFEDYQKAMGEKGIYPSFGDEVLSLNKNQFDTQMQDRKNAIKLAQQTAQSQITANDMRNGEGSIPSLINLYTTGFIDSNTPPDQVIAEFTKISPNFGNLVEEAQISAVFQAKGKHDDTVAQRIQASIAAWADKKTGSNADPAQWGGKGQIGSEFDLTKLSERNKTLITNLTAQASNTARTNEEREVKLLFSQRVAGAEREEEIEAIKVGLKAEYPLLSPAAIERAFNSAGAVESRVRKGLTNGRNEAVNNITSELQDKIASGNFANSADLDSAIQQAFGSFTSLNIPSESITETQKKLQEAFESTLSLAASEQDAAELQLAATAVGNDNSAVNSSGMDAKTSQASIESVGALIANKFGLTKDRDIKDLKQPLVRTFRRVQTLAEQLGIPANKEFIEATVDHIFNGGSADGIEAFGETGASERTILDAMEANLSKTYSVSASMVSYMAVFEGKPLSSMADNPRLRSNYKNRWNTLGKQLFYNKATDVVVEEIGNPRHGRSKLVTNIEDLERGVSTDVHASSIGVKDVSLKIKKLQASAESWKYMYSGENAIKPFADKKKDEFTASRQIITADIGKTAAALRQMIIETKDDIDRIGAQMKVGSFYQSQLSGNNEGVGRRMVAHMEILKQNIVQFDGMLKTIVSTQQTLSETEMDLAPPDVSAVTNKYDIPSPTADEKDDISMFKKFTEGLSVVLDRLLVKPNANVNDIYSELDKLKQKILVSRKGDGTVRVSQIFADAEKVALSRKDFLEMQANERQFFSGSEP